MTTDSLKAALERAVSHIEHMAAWITAQDAFYSFESLGEDMPDIKAALRASTDAAHDDYVRIENAENNGMDKGADFCIKTLAETLGVDDWEQADGSETWHGDVAGTICNVLKAGRVYDEEDGRVAHLEDAHPPAGMREAVRIEVINTPETADFMAGVPLEAAHQRSRWGSEHDAGKSPYDWFWLIGYLAQKAADAANRGDAEKAMHHTISTAAALANWHCALSGSDTSMRPGIDPPALITAD